MLDEVHVFSPSWINDLRAGYSRYVVTRLAQDYGLNAATIFTGANGAPLAGVVNGASDPRDSGLPSIAIGGGFAALGSNANFPAEPGVEYDGDFRRRNAGAFRGGRASHHPLGLSRQARRFEPLPGPGGARLHQFFEFRGFRQGPDQHIHVPHGKHAGLLAALSVGRIR